MQMSKRFLLNFGFLALLLVAIAALGGWFWYGNLEESVTGMGQMMPEGKLRKVMAPADGIIVKVHVNEDQMVKAGQVLFELDPEPNAVQQDTVHDELTLLQQESAALRAVYEGRDSAAIGHVQDAWVNATKIKEETEIKAAELQIENAKHHYQEAVEKEKHLKTLLASQEKLLEQHRQLEAEGGISKKDMLMYEQEVQARRGDLAETQEAVQSRAMELEHARQRPAYVQASSRKEILDRLTEHQRRIVTLAGEAEKVRVNRKRDFVVAPTDGLVNEQVVHSPGEVVKAGTTLLSLVPQKTPLIAEVKVTNRDLAYIHLNQRVELRLDAFPYQQFGRLSGLIHSISPSSVADKDGNPFFLVRVKPERTLMTSEDRQLTFPIKSGMTLSADIITRHKNILSFFTEPLHYHFDRAFRDPSNR